MNKVRFIIPKLLSFLSLPFHKWGERWNRYTIDLAEEIKKEAERESRKPKRPSRDACSVNDGQGSWGKHNWQYKYSWNSLIYDGQAIARGGWRCYHCGRIVWDKTNEQFIADLEEHSPHVLLACTNIRDEYLPFVSTELLEKRVVRKANDKANVLIREKDRVTERLAELEELESQGAMKIKAA